MKLQRYILPASYGSDLDAEDEEWCRAEDVAVLEVEIERLRAEVERLKAPHEILELKQLTKDGAYWFRRKGGTAWVVKNVFPRLGADDGLYIGPLPPPEE